MIFTKTFYYLFILQIKLFIQNKYLYTLSKKSTLFKKKSLCQPIYSVKQIHSGKDELYFEFSFATNEQV